MTRDARLPVINVAPLLSRDADARVQTSREIERACRDLGFFYAIGHGVGADTLAALDAASRRFFALPEARKMEIAMARGGRAWRGYFPIGGELTSGAPDLKQGLYFGEELDAVDARGTCDHGGRGAEPGARRPILSQRLHGAADIIVSNI